MALAYFFLYKIHHVIFSLIIFCFYCICHIERVQYSHHILLYEQKDYYAVYSNLSLSRLYANVLLQYCTLVLVASCGFESSSSRKNTSYTQYSNRTSRRSILNVDYCRLSCTCVTGGHLAFCVVRLRPNCVRRKMATSLLSYRVYVCRIGHDTRNTLTRGGLALRLGMSE